MKHIKALMALLLTMLVVANVAYAQRFVSPPPASSNGNTILNNITLTIQPPSIPSGPTSGVADNSYSYSTSAIDPSGSYLKYTFNWGDGTTSTTSFVKSGTKASMSHTWADSGTYKVTATATNNVSVSSGKSPALSVKIICPPGETNKNGYCQCPSTGQQYVNGMCTCTTPLCNGQCCGEDTVCTNSRCTPCSGGRTACFGHCCPTGYACNSVTGECTKPPHGMPIQK